MAVAPMAVALHVSDDAERVLVAVALASDDPEHLLVDAALVCDVKARVCGLEAVDQYDIAHS